MTKRPGAIALIAIIFISAFALAVMTTASFTASRSLSTVASSKAGDQTFDAAEAGLQDALYRLGADNNTASYTTTINGDSVDIAIENHGFARYVTATATDPLTTTTRKLTIHTTVSTFTGGFNGAVQLATKLQADNGSTVDGNVLVGDSGTSGIICSGTAGCGGAGATFQNGDVQATGASGQANNVQLSGAHNVSAHTISSSTVGGKAYYQNVSGAVKANGGAATCHENDNGPYCFDNSADPVPVSFPMTNSDIATLQGYIPASNTVAGPINIAADQTLGETPQTAPCNTAPFNCKINGNVTITASNAAWTIKGAVVWITGNLTLENPGDIIKLAAAMGSNSSSMIVDGVVSIKNGANLLGSGDPKSFILLISTKNDPVNNVIQTANNSTSVILFAPHGVIEVLNGGNLNNATGYMLHLDNGAKVTYTSNIQSFTIPPKKVDPPTPDPSTWQEL